MVWTTTGLVTASPHHKISLQRRVNALKLNWNLKSFKTSQVSWEQFGDFIKTNAIKLNSCRITLEKQNQYSSYLAVYQLTDLIKSFQVFLSLCSVFLLHHLLSRSRSLWSRTSKWTKRQWWSCTQRSCNCLGTRRAWMPVEATRTKALRSDAPSHRSEEAYCTTSKYKRLKSNQHKEEPVFCQWFWTVTLPFSPPSGFPR